jgi:hypothetical protein
VRLSEKTKTKKKTLAVITARMPEKGKVTKVKSQSHIQSFFISSKVK